MHSRITNLRKNVKGILEVIVGLLKDRVTASEEPANKKYRVEENFVIYYRQNPKLCIYFLHMLIKNFFLANFSQNALAKNM